MIVRVVDRRLQCYNDVIVADRSGPYLFICLVHRDGHIVDLGFAVSILPRARTKEEKKRISIAENKFSRENVFYRLND